MYLVHHFTTSMCRRCCMSYMFYAQRPRARMLSVISGTVVWIYVSCVSKKSERSSKIDTIQRQLNGNVASPGPYLLHCVRKAPLLSSPTHLLDWGRCLPKCRSFAAVAREKNHTFTCPPLLPWRPPIFPCSPYPPHAFPPSIRMHNARYPFKHALNTYSLETPVC